MWDFTNKNKGPADVDLSGDVSMFEASSGGGPMSCGLINSSESGAL